MRMCIENGSTDILEGLVRKDPSIVNMDFSRFGTPLGLVITTRRPLPFIRALLENDADPNKPTEPLQTPLSLAASLPLRVPQNAMINYGYITALIDLLIEKGAKLAHSGALEVADSTISAHLVKKGALEATDDIEYSVSIEDLQKVVRLENKILVTKLMDKGAVAEAISENGETAVDIVKDMIAEANENQDTEEAANRLEILDRLLNPRKALV